MSVHATPVNLEAVFAKAAEASGANSSSAQYGKAMPVPASVNYRASVSGIPRAVEVASTDAYIGRDRMITPNRTVEPISGGLGARLYNDSGQVESAQVFGRNYNMVA